MKVFSLFGVTGVTILDERKKKKNNLYPVKYRFIYLRKQYYVVTGIDLSLEDWNIIETSKRRDLVEKRNLIIDEFDRTTEAVKEVLRKEGGFSFESLKRHLKKGKTSDLFQVFKAKISSLEDSGQIGTAIAYNCALNSIKDYYNKAELKLIDVNISFLKKYEEWMLDKGNGYTTVGIYTRHLRAIYNEARKDFPINESTYPFGKDKYEIPTGGSIKKALSIDQIRVVYNYPIKPGTRKELYRDIWFFSYLCNGMNMYDICLLKYSNIFDNEIAYYRHKTIRTSKKKKLILVTILPEILMIIDKWGNEDKSKNNLIFPFINQERIKKLKKREALKQEKKDVQTITHLINDEMKEIGLAVGIGNISTYFARHSFATILKRSGADISFISEALGHSDVKITENYMDSFEKETRILNAQQLVKYKD